MLVNKTVKKLLDELASKSPAPGGGSISALSGALSAALVSMVCRLTIGKKKYTEVQKEIEEILGTSEKLRKELTKLIDEDTKAYNQVIKAFKLLGGLDIEKALKYATEVPLETAENCKKVLELAIRVAKIGNKNALSDTKIAKLLAQAGIKAAILNVKVNLPLIKDRRFKKRIERTLKNL